MLNIVHGAHDVVNGLLEHKDVQAISFVGSQPVAEYVYTTASEHGKRVQALAGAKNHSIVMPDADLDLTVKEITSAAFGSAGERCMACSVVVAVGDVADSWCKSWWKRQIGSPLVTAWMKGYSLGPVIRGPHKERTLSYIESGEQEGAALIRDGRKDEATGKSGYFVGPTVFDEVQSTMKIWKDEIFAPVLSDSEGSYVGGSSGTGQPFRICQRSLPVHPQWGKHAPIP